MYVHAWAVLILSIQHGNKMTSGRQVGEKWGKSGRPTMWDKAGDKNRETIWKTRGRQGQDTMENTVGDKVPRFPEPCFPMGKEGVVILPLAFRD